MNLQIKKAILAITLIGSTQQIIPITPVRIFYESFIVNSLVAHLTGTPKFDLEKAIKHTGGKVALAGFYVLGGIYNAKTAYEFAHYAKDSYRYLWANNETSKEQSEISDWRREIAEDEVLITAGCIAGAACSAYGIYNLITK